MNKFLVVACLGLTAAFTVQVNADTVVFNDISNVVSDTDLLAGLVAGTAHNWQGAVNQINDGVTTSVANESSGNANSAGGISPQNADVTDAGTYTFTLAPNANGYDISSVDLFSSWSDARSGHDVDLLFSTDNGTTFTSVITNVLNTGTNTFVSTRIDDDAGNLLGTGVTDVQFVVRAGGNVGNGTVFREIDVNGVATVAVPEPSSALVLAGLGLVLLRRRK